MPVPYESIRQDNIRRYGEDIGRIGPMLLAHRYDNRAHFIFELLQNAEDALRRRTNTNHPDPVSFLLCPDALTFSHFGHPFTEENVRFICGIGESTEAHAVTDIGRFGIGFKSVYAFTDSPEIHSGEEHFAIDSFVWPRAVPQATTAEGETVFHFPFRNGDDSAHADIAAGLEGLGLSTLLFLRQIDHIDWKVQGGKSGSFIRDTKNLGGHVRQVTLMGQMHGQSEVKEETYLVFERPVSHKEKPAGQVEIAFRLDVTQPTRVLTIDDATLSVFFPTIVSIGFGAILQGPYRTTPSRDNIPRDDSWNQHLVAETAILLDEALTRLKEVGLLDVSALEALPIRKSAFPEGSLFRPLFVATAEAF
ncbi:MAG: hypothetical protein NTW21_25040 [Verrucomicrobia bacterium]|nr:hypothetical protein [Verrucomicrobiota bacterium]